MNLFKFAGFPKLIEFGWHRWFRGVWREAVVLEESKYVVFVLPGYHVKELCPLSIVFSTERNLRGALGVPLAINHHQILAEWCGLFRLQGSSLKLNLQPISRSNLKHCIVYASRWFCMNLAVRKHRSHDLFLNKTIWNSALHILARDRLLFFPSEQKTWKLFNKLDNKGESPRWRRRHCSSEQSQGPSPVGILGRLTLAEHFKAAEHEFNSCFRTAGRGPESFV